MVFEVGLAEVYDLIYQDKDYEGEVDFVEGLFRDYSRRPVVTVLDGGCGTGGHALPLARRGYQVTGIDASAEMVKLASEKAGKAGLDIGFHAVDLRQIEPANDFDACLCMFNVLGYITGTEEVLKVLEQISNCLKKDGLFIFDCWNGLAVMRVLPSERVKILRNGDKKIIRIATPKIDSLNHICHVDYQLLVYGDSTVLGELQERHTVRYFFPQEMVHYLKDIGFDVVKVCPFLGPGELVDENVWNMTVVSRKR